MALSAIPLSGLTWSNATKAIYRTAKSVVGTKRMRSKYWVYDSRVEVDRVIAERKWQELEESHRRRPEGS